MNNNKNTVIVILVSVLQAILLAWVYKIDKASDRVTTLEANYVNLKNVVDEIRSDIKTLLKRR